MPLLLVLGDWGGRGCTGGKSAALICLTSDGSWHFLLLLPAFILLLLLLLLCCQHQRRSRRHGRGRAEERLLQPLPCSLLPPVVPSREGGEAGARGGEHVLADAAVDPPLHGKQAAVRRLLLYVCTYVCACECNRQAFGASREKKRTHGGGLPPPQNLTSSSAAAC